jgi:Ring finger domain
MFIYINMATIKLNKKSRNKRKSCKKIKHRKKSTTRKHKRCAKCYRGGMINENSQVSLQHTGEDCPICLEPMNINDNTVFTNLFNCRHVFHKVCIIQMIISARSIGNNVFGIVCPMCRAELSQPQGTGTVETINGILDIVDEVSRMNMFRDILQYNYVYHQNFFHLYIIPTARRVGNFVTSDTATILGAGTFFCLSFVIIGSNARQLLRELYGHVLIFQLIRMIFNAGSITRGENRLANAFSVGIFFMSFSFNNLQGNTGHDVSTPYGTFNINDILRYVTNIFERFLVDDSDFFQYFNNLNDHNNREPYGRFGGSAQVINSNASSSNKILRFKFTSTEDVEDFLSIVKQNKEKLGSLLDGQPFTLTVLFPELKYSRELVQKLRPLIKN